MRDTVAETGGSAGLGTRLDRLSVLGIPGRWSGGGGGGVAGNLFRLFPRRREHSRHVSGR
jgi:hypothetical protein